MVRASEISAPKGAGQGKAKWPELSAVVKPAFNNHAVREPGTSIPLLPNVASNTVHLGGATVDSANAVYASCAT